MIDKPLNKVHAVELELDKLLGFKRVAAFGNDQADLVRAMAATYNKAGAETPPPAGATKVSNESE